eukprot:m.99339 g.99339  ORF g.99339 m.99339 type:complete len:201 (+) comp8888_c0_seq3:495-1097(+)
MPAPALRPSARLVGAAQRLLCRSKWSPAAAAAAQSQLDGEQLEAAAAFVRDFVGSRSAIVAITGAGISTDSGIPDYRSPGRPPHRPLMHQEFMRTHANRQRYWARSLFGYRQVHEARPNAAHFAIAEAERRGHIAQIITQNVDGLHQAAGAKNVLQLHGSIHRIVCTTCGFRQARLTLLRAIAAPTSNALCARSIPRWIL